MKTLLRIAAILWIVWGLVHTLAGVLTINAVVSDNTIQAVTAIADGIDPILLDVEYPDAVGGIIGQHGFNLLWFGIVTLIGAIFIWRQSVLAIFITAMVGGLADIRYFIFIDLGGYANFVPGTVMTIVSASAIVLSLIAYFGSNRLENIQPVSTTQAVSA
ncbi:MAG: hypothetical protein AAFR81_28995 [Chloroflexota bacterium]